jgi:hypothetical protein
VSSWRPPAEAPLDKDQPHRGHPLTASVAAAEVVVAVASILGVVLVARLA